MEKFTEIFKKFKTVDIIIVAGVILALIVGFLTYKNFRQTAAKQIEAFNNEIEIGWNAMEKNDVLNGKAVMEELKNKYDL